MSARDLTQGSIPSHIIKLSSTVAVAMVLQSVYALVDLSFVGSLGKESVAGLAVCLQLFFVVLALSRVLGTTAHARVSQLYGAGRIEDARVAATTFLLSALGFGILSAIGAYFSVDVYVQLFTKDPLVATQASIYFRISCLTFVTQLMAMVYGDVLRASGDFRTPMLVMLVSVLLNIVLDAILIFGLGPIPPLGIAGAAWATILSQGFSVVVYSALLFRPRNPNSLAWRPPAWSRKLFGAMLIQGVPAGAQFLVFSVVLGLILAAVKPYGAAWTAAAGGGFRILQQCLLPIVALSFATASIAGQNYGAKQFERVRLATWTAARWAFVYGIFGALMLFFGGRIFGRVFASGEGLDAAAVYFQYTAPSLIAATSIIPTFVLQALGRAILPFFGALLRVCFLCFLLLVIIPTYQLGPKAIFGAGALSALFEFGISYSILYTFLRHLPSSQAKPSNTNP